LAEKIIKHPFVRTDRDCIEERWLSLDDVIKKLLVPIWISFGYHFEMGLICGPPINDPRDVGSSSEAYTKATRSLQIVAHYSN